MDKDLNAAPMNPLPGLVWAALLAMAGIEAVLWLASAGLIGGAQGIGWRLQMIQRFAFSAELQEWMLETRRAPVQHLWRYLSFSFLHGQPAQAALSLVLLAAMGKFVGERLGPLRLALLMAVPPVLGAAVFGLFVGSDPMGWLFGALPMIFGLIGAFTFLRWQAAVTPLEARKAFALVVVLMVARLAMGLMVELGHGWIADLAAFGAGFVLTMMMQRRFWKRLRAS
jgi:rhomboid protease GluP